MNTVYIGIDLTADQRPHNVAVLDDELRIVLQSTGKFDEVVAAVTAYTSAGVAIDAPQSPNAGLMADPARRTQLGLPPNGRTWANCKVCEYELRHHGIGLYFTPRTVEAAPVWMQTGFRLYAALRAEGFELWRPGIESPRTLLEVHPHASFTVLLGHRPLRKDTLEGRLQRQLVLFEEGLDVPDPMNVVDEITRQHMRAGLQNLPGLLSHDELDALVAAYTAFIAAREPGRLTAIGDPDEGQIVLPIAPADFKASYR
jgi:predicted nuclease with RNAse H fold